MLRILQISITFLFVIICTTTAQTTEPPLFPKCEGDICSCSAGTHEAVYNGRKYCATDSKESCPEHAVRLSPRVCECRKGYRFLNDERTECVTERMEQPAYPIDSYEETATDEVVDRETSTEIPTTKVAIPTTTPITNIITTTTTPITINTTTTPATKIITTSTKPDTTRSEESETRSNQLYIYIGIAVMVITALLLIVLLWVEQRQ